jgi:hypothetical protein
MARSHGRLLARIWADSEFLSLSCAAQRAYMLLLSQANLTHAGTIPLTVRRWASKANDTSEQDMIQSLRELEAKRFIAVDGITEELLVRTLIRNDGVFKQPKVFKSAKNDAETISSRKLRRVLVKELKGLPIDNAEVKGDCEALIEALTDPDPEPPERVTDTPSFASPIPNGKSPRSAGGGSPTPAPAPTTHLPVATQPTLQQRANDLTKSYHEAVKGMCKFVAVLGIVKTAIRTDEWTDDEIREALLRLAGEGRSVTIDTLRIELSGLTPRAAPNPLAEKRRAAFAVISNLSNPLREIS